MSFTIATIATTATNQPPTTNHQPWERLPSMMAMPWEPSMMTTNAGEGQTLLVVILEEARVPLGNSNLHGPTGLNF